MRKVRAGYRKRRYANPRPRTHPPRAPRRYQSAFCDSKRKSKGTKRGWRCRRRYGRARVSQIRQHTVLPKLVTVCPYIAIYKTDTFVCLSQVGGHAPPPKARRNHARRGRRPQGRVLQASEKRPVHQNGAPESATQGVTLGRECDLFSFSFSLGSNSSHTTTLSRQFAAHQA